MRRRLLPILLALTACGGSGDGVSALLDPLEAGDDPYPQVPGERCNLATRDGGHSAIRLVAFRDAAVARAGGEPVRLAFDGTNLRAGGAFSGGGVTVLVGGISGAVARAPGRVGIPVVAAVRQGDSVESFEAVWTCGVETRGNS